MVLMKARASGICVRESAPVSGALGSSDPLLFVESELWCCCNELLD
jgi:hypothetical protein